MKVPWKITLLKRLEVNFMFRVTMAEIYKLKRTKILYLSLVGAGLPLLINSMGAAQFELTWEQYYFFNWNMAFLMSPVLFSVLSSYLFVREYQEKAINQLFMYPYQRIKYFIGKFIVCFLLISLTFFLLILGILIIGQLIIPETISLNQLFTFLLLTGLTIVAHWMLVPIAIFVSIITKSYIPPVVLGISATISGLIIMGTEYAIYFPYNSIQFIIANVSPEVFGGGQTPTYIEPVVVLVLSSLMFIFLSVLVYKHSDIHS